MFGTRIIRGFYSRVAKPFYFRRDPEDVHDGVLKMGKFIGSFWLGRFIVRLFLGYKNDILKQDVCGIEFSNPVGLTAGFDKNAELTGILPEVGFGFEVIGSVTGEACEGNPKPRLWRHPDLDSLRVYYGLKNDGCEVISDRLRGRTFEFPVGISIAKTNCIVTVDTDGAVADYVKAFKAFNGIGDFVTVNISCPNTHGGEPFEDAEKLDLLLGALDEVRDGRVLFLKLAANLSEGGLRDIAEVSKKHGVEALVCSNLNKEHDFGDGGLSGKAVEERALWQLDYLYEHYRDDFVLVSVGGIFSAEDAYLRIRRGASLVQLATGMIFKGPQLIGEINRGLAKMLTNDGFLNISEAIGVDKK